MTDNIDHVLPSWQCHKVVRAAKIVAITPEAHGGPGIWLHFDVPYAPVLQTGEWQARHRPNVGGYYVEYGPPDEYTSYSPAAAFEDGYTKLTAIPPR